MSSPDRLIAMRDFALQARRVSTGRLAHSAAFALHRTNAANRMQRAVRHVNMAGMEQ
ncbi:hypothetical protein [Burkholderia pseudomultivorans]|uniref:hypothetical protein n=1 Tax=Burkholderia pseudomultivorans TaxID=1207504 RepID=UPI0012D9D652|nr:hypothetical protein [Burkholderia pseudomultivorans]